MVKIIMLSKQNNHFVPKTTLHWALLLTTVYNHFQCPNNWMLLVRSLFKTRRQISPSLNISFPFPTDISFKYLQTEGQSSIKQHINVWKLINVDKQQHKNGVFRQLWGLHLLTRSADLPKLKDWPCPRGKVIRRWPFGTRQINDRVKKMTSVLVTMLVGHFPCSGNTKLWGLPRIVHVWAKH